MSVFDKIWIISFTTTNVLVALWVTVVQSAVAEPDHHHVHHHRWTDRRGHHTGPHPYHHLVHGGDPQVLLWGLLVHPSPLHHLLHWPGLPRLWVSAGTSGVPDVKFADKPLTLRFVFPCRRIVRGQTPRSLENDPPSVCADQFEDWSKPGTNCSVPVFAGNPPMVSCNFLFYSNFLS